MTKNVSKRHQENPFTEDIDITLTNKKITISPMGMDNNVLINQSTDEVHGTHVVARKRVDSGKFLKVFADYMQETFELSQSGNKALRVLMWAMQEKSVNKNIVTLDQYALIDFLKAHEDHKFDLSPPTFKRGIAQLEHADIIAKSLRRGDYYINPQVIFNGDRVAFTTVIERKEKTEEIEVKQ